MLLQLRVRSDTAEDFVLHIDADASNTFYQLHELLQEECNFDPSHSVAFFSADEEWDKEIEIRIFSDNPHHPFPSDGMIKGNARLGEFLKNKEDKLLYTFDVLNDKSLYIELFEKVMGKTINTPAVKLRKGKSLVSSSMNNSGKQPGAKKTKGLQESSDDSGLLEDLYEIYGDMSSNVF
ncbi:MAG: hypothetical protein Q8909_20015 [Bacteroidota bacterium]|nr:hypothetical protein [Bacteroidota bacterium]